MKMNHKDALHILGLNPANFVEASETIYTITQAYRKACSKFHPDRNPGGLEMMKMINQAHDALSDVLDGGAFDASVKHSKAGAESYGDDLNAALNAIINLGLEIEICGSWIWVAGDTRPHKDALKAAGFKWAPKKKLWHYRPAEYKSFSRGKYSMDQIRAAHGSSRVYGASYRQLEA